MRASLSVVVALSVLLPAMGQARRPIGASSEDRVELPEGDADADRAREEEARKKAEEERRRKAEAEKAAIAEEERKREEAEEAARAAAEAAKKKKAEQAARAKAEAEKKKAEDAAKRKRAALKAARRQRSLARRYNNMQIKIALLPGAPELKAVEEVQVDLSEKLAVPDPRFGEHRPVTGAQLVATVTLAEPEQKARPRGRRRKVAPPPEPMRYRVHALEDAGLYGFHTTLLVPGRYRVEIKGKDSKGQAIEASFDLFPGQWPPPDWDEENARSQASGGRRRPIGL